MHCLGMIPRLRTARPLVDSIPAGASLVLVSQRANAPSPPKGPVAGARLFDANVARAQDAKEQCDLADVGEEAWFVHYRLNIVQLL